MSAIEIKTQNVTPCTKEAPKLTNEELQIMKAIGKPNLSDFKPEDIFTLAAYAGMFDTLHDKALMLKKIHNSLGLGGIENIFDLENPKLTNEEHQILKGIEFDLKKRGKCMDDINRAFDTQDPKWTLQKMINVKSLMGLVNCQRYKIEEKLTNINLTKWSQEQLKISQKVSMTFRIQAKLIKELKQMLTPKYLVSLIDDCLQRDSL